MARSKVIQHAHARLDVAKDQIRCMLQVYMLDNSEVTQREPPRS
jgi:hypothetical protein